MAISLLRWRLANKFKRKWHFKCQKLKKTKSKHNRNCLNSSSDFCLESFHLVHAERPMKTAATSFSCTNQHQLATSVAVKKTKATSKLIWSPLTKSVGMASSCFWTSTSQRRRKRKDPREESEGSRWWWWWREEQGRHSLFCQWDLQIRCRQPGRANPGVVRTVTQQNVTQVTGRPLGWQESHGKTFVSILRPAAG